MAEAGKTAQARAKGPSGAGMSDTLFSALLADEDIGAIEGRRDPLRSLRSGTCPPAIDDQSEPQNLRQSVSHNSVGQADTAPLPSPRPIADERAVRTRSPARTPSTPSHVVGHRDRLRARFRDAGPSAVADYELLELLLFRSIPRRDTKPVAKALIRRFGSFAAVLNAPPHLLTEVEHVGDAVALDLKLVAAATNAVNRSEIVERDVLASWSAVLDYLNAAMAHATKEQFRILFLDKKNRLIADEVQQEGTVDHTPVYVREIARRALELSATAIVLVHNHPSGDPKPSRPDIEMTHRIGEAMRPLGIVLHDHIIISRNGHSSFRAEGLLT